MWKKQIWKCYMNCLLLLLFIQLPNDQHMPRKENQEIGFLISNNNNLKKVECSMSNTLAADTVVSVTASFGKMRTEAEGDMRWKDEVQHYLTT